MSEDRHCKYCGNLLPVNSNKCDFCGNINGPDPNSNPEPAPKPFSTTPDTGLEPALEPESGTKSATDLTEKESTGSNKRLLIIIAACILGLLLLWTVIGMVLNGDDAAAGETVAHSEEGTADGVGGEGPTSEVPDAPDSAGGAEQKEEAVSMLDGILESARGMLEKETEGIRKKEDYHE